MEKNHFMLQKIIHIKNVGRFLNSSMGGNTTLAKHNLIYGANGYGKTTICSILRSLKNNDAVYVLGRKTLGVSDSPPTIELLTTVGKIKFNDTTWSGGTLNLAIFDGTFVAENVHSGDVVDIDHKRNLYRVIVGESGVELAKQESTLASESRAKTTEITNISKAIQSHMPQGMKLEDFIALPKIENIDELICTKNQN